MKQNSSSEVESGDERQKKPTFNVNTSPSSTKSSQPGGLGKFLTRISKFGELGLKVNKPNGDQRKGIQLPQMLLVPSRRHSASASVSSFSKKLNQLIPLRKSSTDPVNGFSRSNGFRHNQGTNKTAARPRSFSVTPELATIDDCSPTSDEVYCQGSYIQRKGGSTRKGFGGIYRRSVLPVHIEDDVNTEEEEELFEVHKVHDVSVAPENCLLEDTRIFSRGERETSDLCKDLSFFSCPNVNEGNDILGKDFQTSQNLNGHRSEASESSDKEEEETDCEEEEASTEMRKVKAQADLRKDEGKCRRGPSHLPLSLKDDPRKTILDQTGLKRHSLSQAAIKISGCHERPESACFLTSHVSHDDVTADDVTVGSSFRSSMPIVSSHASKDFGSHDRVLRGTYGHVLRHHHQYDANYLTTKTTSDDVQRQITFAFNSSNVSLPEGNQPADSKQTLEKTCRPGTAFTASNSSGINSKINFGQFKASTKTDTNDYLRFRDMKDARRKFFESDTSLGTGHDSLTSKNPFLGFRPKSSAALSFADSSRSPTRASERHSADIAMTNRHHHLLLSQLSFEPKLLQEEREKFSPRSDKFDKRFSTSMTTVNGNDSGIGTLSVFTTRDQEEIQKDEDWRTSRTTEQYNTITQQQQQQYNTFSQQHLQKKQPSAIPIRHHRKRESLDSGFDMKMEDTNPSYPASEDSLTSISSPDSFYRIPVFSPPHTKTTFPSTAPITNWLVSPKLFSNSKDTPNGRVYTSMSVSSTSFSCQTTKRTISRGTILPSISIFQLTEDDTCPLVQSLKQLTEQLRLIEMELIGYAVAIVKSHKESEKTPSLFVVDEDKKHSSELHLPPNFISSYTPKFLGDPLLLSCFHVKEFFPKFFLDKFPWQPMSCYCFDDSSHNNTLTEDNCEESDDDDDDLEKEDDQLDYPVIRKKLDELTRMQVEYLKKMQNFLEENLKISKDKRNQVFLKIQPNLTDKELERCSNFSSESDKILKLLILLSQRLSKHHEEATRSGKTQGNSLKNESSEPRSASNSKVENHKDGVDHQQAKKKDLKLSELETRLADARHLKESIEKRGNNLNEVFHSRYLDTNDVRQFFRSNAETFVLSLILLWVLERIKLASEFLQGLEKLAEDEWNLMKQRERKKRRKNKATTEMAESLKREMDVHDDGEDDDDDEFNRL